MCVCVSVCLCVCVSACLQHGAQQEGDDGVGVWVRRPADGRGVGRLAGLVVSAAAARPCAAAASAHRRAWRHRESSPPAVPPVCENTFSSKRDRRWHWRWRWRWREHDASHTVSRKRRRQRCGRIWLTSSIRFHSRHVCFYICLHICLHVRVDRRGCDACRCACRRAVGATTPRMDAAH